MKRIHCPHNRVIRTRGPQKDAAWLGDGSSMVGLRVWEVCLRCGHHRWIRFQGAPG